ncbi:cell differentiation protein [Babesia caballi]|uniref:Cell differentiation protein n=1 Tax=Babesia caballi TaxID=5871 RepID=A0AAV4LPU1_BABCB|nr:cell differentiation protein [Babesia caballi]
MERGDALSLSLLGDGQQQGNQSTLKVALAQPSRLPTMDKVSECMLNQMILDLAIHDKREYALAELSKQREHYPDLPLLLWYSFGTVATLLYEIISVYHYLYPLSLTMADSTKASNSLTLLQCIASHPHTRPLFLAAHIPLYLYPFLNTSCKSRRLEYLKLTCLGVIGALVKSDDEDVICFLLDTEIIALCLRIMETGSDISKTVSIFIVQKVMLDERGLAFVCATAERFYALTTVLHSMVLNLMENPSRRRKCTCLYREARSCANTVLIVGLVLANLLAVLVVDGGLLVLLVLADEVVHVGLRLGELHLVHALAGVPVKEGLAPEHGGELLRHTLEHVLDGGGVADEGDGHLQALGRDVADAGLGVVGDPLDEVGAVLVLHHGHLLVDFLCAHAAAEHGARGEVAAPPGVGGAHHVLGVEHLLGELGDGERAVLLAAPAGERGETDHEEVEPGEGDQVDGELPEVGVELARETQGAGHAGHGGRDQVVEVAVGGRGELEGAETDVVQRLVVDDLDLVGVLDELVHGERGVVGLHDGVRDLGRREDGEGLHDPVGVLLTDLADEQRSHTTSGTTTERVGDLEALEAVAPLGLLAYNIKDGVD